MIRFYDGNLFLEVIARSISDWDYHYLRDDTENFTKGLEYDPSVNAYLVDDIQTIINQANKWFHDPGMFAPKVLVAGVGFNANGNLLEIRNANNPVWLRYDHTLTGREVWHTETGEWILEHEDDATTKFPQTEYVEWEYQGLYTNTASWCEFGKRDIDHLPLK